MSTTHPTVLDVPAARLVGRVLEPCTLPCHDEGLVELESLGGRSVLFVIPEPVVPSEQVGIGKRELPEFVSTCNKIADRSQAMEAVNVFSWVVAPYPNFILREVVNAHGLLVPLLSDVNGALLAAMALPRQPLPRFTLVIECGRITQAWTGQFDLATHLDEVMRELGIEC